MKIINLKFLAFFGLSIKVHSMEMNSNIIGKNITEEDRIIKNVHMLYEIKNRINEDLIIEIINEITKLNCYIELLLQNIKIKNGGIESFFKTFNFEKYFLKPFKNIFKNLIDLNEKNEKLLIDFMDNFNKKNKQKLLENNIMYYVNSIRKLTSKVNKFKEIIKKYTILFKILDSFDEKKIYSFLNLLDEFMKTNNKTINDLEILNKHDIYDYKNIEIYAINILNNKISHHQNIISKNKKLHIKKNDFIYIYEDLKKIYGNCFNENNMLDKNFIKIITENNDNYVINSKNEVINFETAKKEDMEFFLKKIEEQNYILLKEIKLNRGSHTYLLELYKNICLFFIENILDLLKNEGKNELKHNEFLKSILDYNFDEMCPKSLLNNFFTFQHDFSILNKQIKNNIITKFKALNINITISDECICCDFENEENLFKLIPKLNFNEDIKVKLINNNGGSNIIIPNNNMEIITSGNCSLHALINFIIGGLFYINDNNIINESTKYNLQKSILENVINFIENIKNVNLSEKKFPEYKELNEFCKSEKFIKLNKQNFAFSGHEKIKEEEFFKIFDISIEKNIDEILKNKIDVNNKVLTDFFIKLYDILVIFFRGNYYFTHNNETFL